MSYVDTIPAILREPLTIKISEAFEKNASEIERNFDHQREEDLLGAVAIYHDAPYIDLQDSMVDHELCKKFNPGDLHHHRFLPLFQQGKTLWCASPNPWLIQIKDAIQNTLQSPELHISFLTISDNDLNSWMRQQGLIGQDYVKTAETLQVSKETADQTISLTPEAKHVWGLISQIFIDCINKNATELHIEPEGDRVRLRAEINGTLQDLDSLPSSLSGTIDHILYSKTKTMKGDRWRFPQSGSFTFPYQNRQINVRIQTVGRDIGLTSQLVHTTVRFQDSQRNKQISIESLPFDSMTQTIIQNAAQEPGALCIIAGPTGSGKTTTLGAILKFLATDDRMIYAVEDPVENIYPGVIHVLADRDAGINFSSVLKALLRKKPHVIMVGEMRERETGEVVIEGALTGHIMLTTVHCDFACEIPERLTYLGIQPFQIASKLKLCSSQRLIKEICTHCCNEVELTPQLQKKNHYSSAWIGKTMKFHNPLGCSRCNHGYQSRRPIIEVMPTDEKLIDLIYAGARPRELQNYAVESLGMKTLKQSAIALIEQGITDFDGVKSGISIG
ncbi:MAG: ATPase, T2SS/T4P/T4SS family [Verrucomicrobiota bacterium]